MRKFHTFQSRSGLFYCVSLKGDRVHGPFTSEREVRAAKPLITTHERCNRVVDAALKPQPLPERDINPLTRN